MEKAKIDRINELKRIERERGLTDEEKNEQAKLRREFIDDIKSQVIQSLDNVRIVDEKGNKRKVEMKESENIKEKS